MKGATFSSVLRNANAVHIHSDACGRMPLNDHMAGPPKTTQLEALHGLARALASGEFRARAVLERACAAVAGGFGFQRVGIVRFLPDTSTLVPFAGHGLTMERSGRCRRRFPSGISVRSRGRSRRGAPCTSRIRARRRRCRSGSRGTSGSALRDRAAHHGRPLPRLHDLRPAREAFSPRRGRGRPADHVRDSDRRFPREGDRARRAASPQRTEEPVHGAHLHELRPRRARSTGRCGRWTSASTSLRTSNAASCGACSPSSRRDSSTWWTACSTSPAWRPTRSGWSRQSTFGRGSQSWRAAVFELSADLTIDVPDDLRATVDPQAFDRVVSNLLVNARRHGGPPVVVTARRNGSDLDVVVEDRGAGVPADFADSLFDRFTRLATNDGEGAGLGLAIARSYARSRRQPHVRASEPAWRPLPAGLASRLIARTS